MSAEIVTVGFCPQYFASFEVTGSTGNSYTVTLNGAEAPAHCTCPSYRYGGSQDCKHIKAVWDHGCLYNPQWKDAGPNDLGSYGVSVVAYDYPGGRTEPCPGCGEAMVPVRIAV
jgi:hypothetical protein